MAWFRDQQWWVSLHLTLFLVGVKYSRETPAGQIVGLRRCSLLEFILQDHVKLS